MYKYNPAGDVWSAIAPIPRPVAFGIGFSNGTYGYAGLGQNKGYCDSLFKYDPSLNSWSPIAPYPGKPVYNAASFIMNDLAYITGGQDTASGVMSRACYMLNTKVDAWSQVDSIPAARSALEGFVLNGTGYVALGNQTGATPATDIFQYDQTSDLWSTPTNFPGTSSGLRYSCFVLKNEVYFCNDSAQLWKFNPITIQWQRLPDPPFKMAGATFVLNGVAFVIAESTKEVWQFCPGTFHVHAGKNESICKGTQAFLYSTGGASWSWAPATGILHPDSANISVYPADTTVYVVTAKDSAGCSAKDSVRINIIPLPVIQAKSNRSILCPGDTTQLMSSGGTSYSWSPQVGLNNPSAPNPIASPAVTTNYQLTVTDAKGCINTDSVLIILDKVPNISCSANPSLICPGDTSILQATGSASYSWSPGGTLNTSLGNNIRAYPAASTTYSITATDTNGCISKGAVLVNVYQPASVVVTASPPTVCPGASSTLLASGAISYSWSPGGTLNATTGSQVSASPTSGTTYTITSTDANNCVSKQFSFVNTFKLPVVQISANPASVCPGDTSVLLATGAASFSWTPSGSLNATEMNNIRAYPVSKTTYTVTYMDSSGTCKTSDTLVVGVNPSTAVPVISVNTAVLTSSNAIGNQWFLNGSALPGSVYDTLTVHTNGTYKVCTADAILCTSCSAPFVFNAMGILAKNTLDVLSVFPNPAVNSFSIRLGLQQETTLEISLFNSQGKMLQTLYSGIWKPDAPNLRVETNDLSSGMYFLLIRSKGAEIRKLIVIEKS
jgi:hypothetical protein